jgi:hypothetical protein
VSNARIAQCELTLAPEAPPSPRQWRGSVPCSHASHASPPSTGVLAYAREKRDAELASPGWGLISTDLVDRSTGKELSLPALYEILEVLTPFDTCFWLVLQLWNRLTDNIC